MKPSRMGTHEDANPAGNAEPSDDPALRPGMPIEAMMQVPPVQAGVRYDHTGETLGDFRLLRRLGEGGMGQVYLAEQQSLQRRVAVKLLRSDIAQNETFLKRFEAEAKAIAQLTHPNIVQVYSVGNAQGLRYMALEYVEGTNLKDYLNKKGPPELPIALIIMKQVASALQKAAEIGIIHRDIKPENILLTRKVEVKVTDFGLSRVAGEDLNLTQTGTTMGTPLYMSPEQVMGKPVDPRSDLYSFGATCYHLLAGHPPFTAETAMAVGVQHISETPVSLAILRPDLPPLLVDLVHRLLGKKPEDRPQSAREVLREIRKIQEGIAGGTASMATSELPETEEPYETTASAPPEWTPRSSPAESRSKRPWLVPIAGASVMLAIIGGAVIGMMLRDDTHTRATATLSTATQRVDALKELQLEREKALIRNVEETRYYQRDPEKPFDFLANTDRYPQGIRARAELLSFYMDKLADEGMARKMKIFVEEEANARVAPEPYRCIGIIGQALVLATEGKARESYEHLEKAIIAKNNSNVKRIILNSFLRVPDLVEVMLFTLRLNEKNMPVPASLQSVKEELEKASKAGPGERGRPKK